VKKFFVSVIISFILLPSAFTQSFTSVSAFDKWLEKQHSNTATAPYTVKLNTRDLSGIRDALSNATKHVSLDLTGSTFTIIGQNTNESFSGCTSLTSIIIGNKVTIIGEDTFKGCHGLTSVTIPNNVTSIGAWAFSGCMYLTNVSIGNGVTSIGDYAFNGCHDLTSITIPDAVTSIGAFAFRSCVSLTSITMGNGVTSIGDYALDGCHDLTSVTFKGSISAGNYGSTHIDDLRNKYLAAGGGPGRYTRSNDRRMWTKQ
jgi:hypothetical protein